MKTALLIIGALLVLALLAAVGVYFYSRESATIPVEQGYGPDPTLPPPNPKPITTVNIAEDSSWPEGITPTVAAGMKVNVFAKGLDHLREIY